MKYKTGSSLESKAQAGRQNSRDWNRQSEVSSIDSSNHPKEGVSEEGWECWGNDLSLPWL